MTKFSPSIFKLLSVDQFSGIPKYKQLIDNVINAANLGRIEKGRLMPSINEMSANLELARDTVEKAYRQLKIRGVLEARPGKGYYLSREQTFGIPKVALFFNKLSAHKKVIYDSFMATIGQLATVDLFIYNNDIETFSSLMVAKEKEYTHLVVLPHFDDDKGLLPKILGTISGERLIVLDKLIPSLGTNHSAVFQDFSNDLFEALEEALPLLSKYNRLNIIFPVNHYFPREILRGFFRFCEQFKFDHRVIKAVDSTELKKGEVYIDLIENDLVELIEAVLKTDLKLGQDIGVISYNETPIKRIILNGITTISTDFVQLGSESAKVILEGDIRRVKVPFRLNKRGSL
jgi:DNA-binding transcriptional regulator YhcF (GntR family)